MPSCLKTREVENIEIHILHAEATKCISFIIIKIGTVPYDGGRERLPRGKHPSTCHRQCHTCCSFPRNWSSNCDTIDYKYTKRISIKPINNKSWRKTIETHLANAFEPNWRLPALLKQKIFRDQLLKSFCCSVTLNRPEARWHISLPTCGSDTHQHNIDSGYVSRKFLWYSGAPITCTPLASLRHT